jgi:hypothetical protein
MNVTARCAFEGEDVSDTLADLDLAEVDYFLRDERAAMRTFMQNLTRGAFTSVDHLLWRWPSCSASMRIAMRDVRISSPFDSRAAGRSIWSC